MNIFGAKYPCYGKKGSFLGFKIRKLRTKFDGNATRTPNLFMRQQAAKTINNIATNIDEQEIKAQLNELEKLLNETTHHTENIIGKETNSL